MTLPPAVDTPLHYGNLALGAFGRSFRKNYIYPYHMVQFVPDSLSFLPALENHISNARGY